MAHEQQLHLYACHLRQCASNCIRGYRINVSAPPNIFSEGSCARIIPEAATATAIHSAVHTSGLVSQNRVLFASICQRCSSGGHNQNHGHWHQDRNANGGSSIHCLFLTMLPTSHHWRLYHHMCREDRQSRVT